MVNGKSTRPFHAKRGIRQRDPLSRYLFVLAMDYLIRKLKSLHNHPRCRPQKIVHFNFADDFLLFCRSDLKSVKCLHSCLEMFSHALGVIANTGKSVVYFGGVKQNSWDHIL